MKSSREKYSKMLAEFDINDLPRVKSEIKENSGGCFLNHSGGAEDRLVSATKGRRSLAIMRELFKS